MDLGQQIRAARKKLSISAAVAAEAAGLSRTTLHRIERGEPSVTMGAYMSVISTVGLKVLLGPQSVRGHGPPTLDFESIPIVDYPELRRLAWHLTGATKLSPRDAFEIYDRNRKHLVGMVLSSEENKLLQRLKGLFGA